MKKILFALICVLATGLSAHAQRLVPKQRGIEIMGGVPVIKGEKLLSNDGFGVGIALTRYLKRDNYTFLMAEYEQQTAPYREYSVPIKDYLVQVGYMQPILSDRGKNIMLYFGVSALCGYEELNKDNALLPDGATLLDESAFVYGGAAHLSVECFLADNLLFVLKAQGRMLFGSDVHCFRPAVSAGFKFNL